MEDFIGQELNPGDLVAYANSGFGKHMQVGFVIRVNAKTVAVFPIYNVGKKYRGTQGQAQRFNKSKYPHELIKIQYNQIPAYITNKFTEKQILLFLNTIRTKDVTKLVSYARN